MQFGKRMQDNKCISWIAPCARATSCHFYLCKFLIYALYIYLQYHLTGLKKVGPARRAANIHVLYTYNIQYIHILIIHICQYTSTFQGVLFDPHTEWWYGIQPLGTCLSSILEIQPSKKKFLSHQNKGHQRVEAYKYILQICVYSIYTTVQYFMYIINPRTKDFICIVSRS